MVDSSTSDEKSNEAKTPSYTIQLTSQFVTLSVLLSFIVAFSVGWISRLVLIDTPEAAIATPVSAVADNVLVEPKLGLPTPILFEGKSVPPIIYTAKHFDTSAASSTTSQFIEKQDVTTGKEDTEESSCSSSGQCSRSSSPTPSNEDDSEHLPAGQHLFIDIANVNSEFLNSEVRLAQAMIDVVGLSKLTLLSYHCHSLIPVGVSCVGVLLESHVSFHTWPVEGVITLDLFTCGSGELVPILPIIEKLFAIPKDPKERKAVGGVAGAMEDPVVQWSHNLRGFRGNEGGYLSAELGTSFIGWNGFSLKEKVVSTTTKFQHIDVYNFINPRVISYESYLGSHLHPSNTTERESYLSRNPDLFRPNRIVFLDGVVQSTLHGLEAYHEALVHPAMFAHPNPKRVAIIGGGEAATLKEVLKHDVDMVKMIEIDEEMVQVSKESLPEWSDCTDLQWRVDGWCGDDENAEIVYGDAMSWFIDRFGDNKLDKDEFKEERFDVLIMDALDPQDNVPFADVLYNNQEFLTSLYNALNDDGMIVLQLGMAPTLRDPPESFSRDSRRDMLANSLAEVGFKSLHMYEEGACGFEDPWTFLVAMKDSTHTANWLRSVAELDYQIYARTFLTHSGTPALKFFDSSTMKRYQLPTKGHEVVYCRKDPVPNSCNAFNIKTGTLDYPISNFEVKESTVGNDGGRGVFTKVDIKEGSMLAMADNLKYVHIPSSTVQVLENMHYNAPFDVGRVLDYVYGYGWSAVTGRSKETLMEHYLVDSGIFTFMNHGCDESYNIVSRACELSLGKLGGLNLTETNSRPEHYNIWQPREIFDPYLDRHLPHKNAWQLYARRDLVAGEEILDNYVFHTENEDVWYDYTQYLQRICAGEEAGEVTKSEIKRKS